MKPIDSDVLNIIENNMKRGGPGDKTKPGEYDTTAWFHKTSKTIEKSMEDPNSITSLTKDKDIWFCSIPFTQVYSEINGNYQACCFAADSKVSIDDVSLEDWMEKSEYMNSIRREMLDPNSDHKAVEKICTRCRSDEKRYGRSRRTNCMKMHTNDPNFWDGIERSARFFKQTGEYYFDERICEIQLKIFGSECNLDCHMCMHANSTTRWNMALKKGVWNDELFGQFDERVEYVTDVLKDRSIDKLEQITKLAPYTRSIKIIGGEPLIMKRQYELLDALIECDEAKNIIIKYQTNFTKMQAGRHNIFDYIPKFYKVAMVASVDGIGRDIEYMRRRTDWAEVEKNIDICNEYDNTVVDFNGLVSFLSVMRFHKVIDYCKDNPKIHQINWAMIEDPKPLRVNNLPYKIKNKLIPLYEDWPDIQAALQRPPENDCNIQDVLNYLLKQDEAYVGTKWEMHLFEEFPELEEFWEG
jgi:hypothetical protein